MKALLTQTSRLSHASKRLLIAILLFIGLAGAVSVKLTFAHEQDIQKLNRFVQTSRNEAAVKVFREGRDSIEGEKWQQAAEKFQNFIASFPKDRDMDAALYWYAYALQKQGQKDEAAAPLLRVIKEFPNSTWRREAEAMLVVLGRGPSVQQALDRNNCEMKILALQSLFQGDEDRAVNFVSELLKSNSESCPGLKVAALSLAGSNGGPRVTPLLLEVARNQGDLKLRLTAIRRLGEQNSDSVADELARLYEADKATEIRTQILRALAEMHTPRAEAKLIEVARSGGGDVVARQMAIRYLGEVDGANSLDELIRLFDTDSTPEIRAQILRALSERDDPRAQAKLLEIARKGDTPQLRVEAIRRLGDRGDKAIEDLLQLYATESNPQIKLGLIRAYADIQDPRAAARLFEIARTADTPELRAYAIRRLGDRTDPQTVDQLIAMYDAETNLQIKAMILRGFGDSQQKSAVRKLIAVARDSPSVELRKMAVKLLGENKDPEALKFLEDLLK
jgi:HEAT repeat protein